MALPVKRNLGSMRQEMRDRLGFAAMGAQAGPNAAIIDSFLRQAQVMLYWEWDWKYLIKTTNITTQIGQNFYDWPSDVDPDRLISVVAVDNGSSTPNIFPLVEGIDWAHDNYNTPATRPERYERRSQIEVWPEPDSAQYEIRLEYIQRLGAFTVDADLATIEEDVIIMFALVAAKAHYRHPDAGIYGQQTERFLRRLKGKNLGNKRFVRGDNQSHGDPYSADPRRHVNTLDQ